MLFKVKGGTCKVHICELKWNIEYVSRCDTKVSPVVDILIFINVKNIYSIYLLYFLCWLKFVVFIVVNDINVMKIDLFMLFFNSINFEPKIIWGGFQSQQKDHFLIGKI